MKCTLAHSHKFQIFDFKWREKKVQDRVELNAGREDESGVWWIVCLRTKNQSSNCCWNRCRSLATLCACWGPGRWPHYSGSLCWTSCWVHWNCCWLVGRSSCWALAPWRFGWCDCSWLRSVGKGSGCRSRWAVWAACVEARGGEALGLVSYACWGPSPGTVSKSLWRADRRSLLAPCYFKFKINN